MNLGIVPSELKGKFDTFLSCVMSSDEYLRAADDSVVFGSEVLSSPSTLSTRVVSGEALLPVWPISGSASLLSDLVITGNMPLSTVQSWYRSVGEELYSMKRPDFRRIKGGPLVGDDFIHVSGPEVYEVLLPIPSFEMANRSFNSANSLDATIGKHYVEGNWLVRRSVDSVHQFLIMKYCFMIRNYTVLRMRGGTNLNIYFSLFKLD